MDVVITFLVKPETLFVGSVIIYPYIPALTLFTMPLTLILLAVFNLNTTSLNYWYSTITLQSLPWWNILYGILCTLGVFPSFILVPHGLVGIILTFLLRPFWAGFEILATIIYWSSDPNLYSFLRFKKWLYCIFGNSSSCS